MRLRRVAFRHSPGRRCGVNGTTTARLVDLTVNGSAAGSINFGTTANWVTWANSTVTATLTSGSNTIRVTSSTANRGPNLDWVEVS